jgi:hypothetical protein
VVSGTKSDDGADQSTADNAARSARAALISIGISATGVVTGNYVADNMEGIGVFAGSTVIGNAVLNNLETGIVAQCPLT